MKDDVGNNTRADIAAIVGKAAGEPTEAMEDILKEVCLETGYSEETLKGKDRTHKISAARQYAWFRMHNAGHPLTKIGRYMGRDRTGVIDGVRKTYKRLGLEVPNLNARQPIPKTNEGENNMLQSQSRASVRNEEFGRNWGSPNQKKPEKVLSYTDERQLLLEAAIRASKDGRERTLDDYMLKFRKANIVTVPKTLYGVLNDMVDHKLLNSEKVADKMVIYRKA